MQEMQVQYMGCEDNLAKGMATHSTIPAWKMPWTKEPGRLLLATVHGLQRVRHHWTTNTLFSFLF